MTLTLHRYEARSLLNAYQFGIDPTGYGGLTADELRREFDSVAELREAYNESVEQHGDGTPSIEVVE